MRATGLKTRRFAREGGQRFRVITQGNTEPLDGFTELGEEAEQNRTAPESKNY